MGGKKGARKIAWEHARQAWKGFAFFLPSWNPRPSFAKMGYACCGSCETSQAFPWQQTGVGSGWGDFTARRLRRSIVEKQELEREIFIDIKTIPLKQNKTKTLTIEGGKKCKDTAGKKKKPFWKCRFKMFTLLYQPTCTLESAIS